jgi:hypothetical protein
MRWPFNAHHYPEGRIYFSRDQGKYFFHHCAATSIAVLDVLRVRRTNKNVSSNVA